MVAQDNEWVYVLKNPYMPGLVKIGFTAKQPAERAAELSRATGVPATFEVVFAASIQDADAGYVERCIHRELDVHRINPMREFFMLSVEAAKNLVTQSLKRNGIDIRKQLLFMTSTLGTTLESMHPTGDRLLGVEDGREWPPNAEKWQWELVLKYQRLKSETDGGFCYFMKNVVGSGLQKPNSPQYLLGFYEGVHDCYSQEENLIEERR